MKSINDVDSLLPAVADRYRLLARLAFLASSSLDLDEVLLRLAEELHPLLGCDQFRLVSRDGVGRLQQRTVDFHPEATLSLLPLAALTDAAAQGVATAADPPQPPCGTPAALAVWVDSSLTHWTSRLAAPVEPNLRNGHLASAAARAEANS